MKTILLILATLAFFAGCQQATNSTSATTSTSPSTAAVSDLYGDWVPNAQTSGVEIIIKSNGTAHGGPGIWDNSVFYWQLEENSTLSIFNGSTVWAIITVNVVSGHYTLYGYTKNSQD
jgi:hypothetical protein